MARAGGRECACVNLFTHRHTVRAKVHTTNNARVYSVYTHSSASLYYTTRTATTKHSECTEIYCRALDDFY